MAELTVSRQVIREKAETIGHQAADRDHARAVIATLEAPRAPEAIVTAVIVRRPRQ